MLEVKASETYPAMLFMNLYNLQYSSATTQIFKYIKRSRVSLTAYHEIYEYSINDIIMLDFN